MIAAPRGIRIVLGLSGLLFALACGDDSPEPADSGAASQTPAAVPPGLVPTGDASGPVELPETLPGGVPLLSGLSPTAVRTEDAGVAIQFDAEADAAQVAADYAKLLESDGWTAVIHEDPGGFAIIASKGTATTFVRVAASESGATVQMVATP